jgi:hypothetical protein
LSLLIYEAFSYSTPRERERERERVRAREREREKERECARARERERKKEKEKRKRERERERKRERNREREREIAWSGGSAHVLDLGAHAVLEEDHLLSNLFFELRCDGLEGVFLGKGSTRSTYVRCEHY